MRVSPDPFQRSDLVKGLARATTTLCVQSRFRVILCRLTYFEEHKKCMAEGQGLLAAAPKHDWVIIA